jgi:hypothetical protein
LFGRHDVCAVWGSIYGHLGAGDAAVDVGERTRRSVGGGVCSATAAAPLFILWTATVFPSHVLSWDASEMNVVGLQYFAQKNI